MENLLFLALKKTLKLKKTGRAHCLVAAKQIALVHFCLA